MDQYKKIFPEFEKATNEFIEVLSSFTQEEINKIPFEGSWTAGQVARHMLKATRFMPELLQGDTQPTERAPDEKAAILREVFLNFDKKLQSPDFIVPESRSYDRERLLNDLRDTQQRIIHAAQPLDLTATCMGFEMPRLGHLTRYESIFFAMVHTLRHAHQLKNIRENLSLAKVTGSAG